MQNKVSIIVPVYNGELYLNRCLKSIKNQTYPNLEVILVDDGSLDNSFIICLQYAQEDRRFKAYNKANEGASSARNYGLEKATGDYVQFVDCDDYLKEDATERLVAAISDVDMVICAYRRLFGSYQLIQHNLERPGVYAGEEYLIKTLKDPGHHYYGVNWNKLYKLAIIKEHQLYFRRDISLGEDFVFSLHYWMHARDIRVISDVLYQYNCYRTQSLSRYGEKNIDISKWELTNRKLIWEEYVQCFKSCGLYEKYQKKMEHYWINYYVRQQYHIKHDFNYWEQTDRFLWRKIIECDNTILSCRKRVGKLNFIMKRTGFTILSNLKRLVKKGIQYISLKKE